MDLSTENLNNFVQVNANIAVLQFGGHKRSYVNTSAYAVIIESLDIYLSVRSCLLFLHITFLH